MLMAQNGAPARIGVGDKLSVQVLGESDMSGMFIVLTDGAIDIPKVGRVIVKGLTAEVAQARLTNRLRKQLKHPSAWISIREQMPLAVYVVGGTSNGTVPLVQGTDLRGVFAQSKILAEFDTLSVSVYRDGKRICNEDASLVVGGSPTAWNGPLENNDVVVVEPKASVRVWVVGNVKSPGEIRIPKGAGVYKAIAKAGDILTSTTESAPIRDEYRITLRRGPTEIPVPVYHSSTATEQTLEDGDTIYVETPKRLKVTVAGEVKTPGEEIVKEGTSLAATVGLAGGINALGSLTNVILYRKGEARFMDISSALTKAQPGLGPTVEDGDVVFVGRNEKVFYVFGEAKGPGRYVIPDATEYRLSDAVAAAGGATSTGSLHHVYVVHPGPEGKAVTQEFQFDEFLKAGNQKANPMLEPHTVIYIGRPRGFTLTEATQILSSIFFVESITGVKP